MRTIAISIIAAITLAAFTLPSSSNPVDEQSSITWVGKKVTGMHTGSVDFKSAEFVYDAAGALTEVEFVVDMTTITCTDLKGDMAGKLVGHLNSADFFDVENHPTATFSSSTLKSLGQGRYAVEGDLTIKGITKPLTLEANIERIKGETLATAKVNVDRTAYDIKYGSGSFFKGLGDKMIDDTFILDVTVRK